MTTKPRAAASRADRSPVESRFLPRAKKLAAQLTRWRREFHTFPEPAFREERTAERIAEILRDLGLSHIRTGIARTGVVCDLGRGKGPIVALRADMDALPIMDAKKVPYASKRQGFMHACGHDAHVAMLLGAADLLQGWFARSRAQGRVRLIFQPAEEIQDEEGLSGAARMVRAGILADVAGIFALHVDSTRPLGSLVIRSGQFTAAVDTFAAWISAIGGHGAYPHDGRDPIWMLILILAALHGIVARRVDPLQPAVVSVGQIHGGTASNILPHEVFLEGTLRSFDPQVREHLIMEVENALVLARSLGGDFRIKIQRGYPPTTNHPDMVRLLTQAGREEAGLDRVIDAPIGMGGEDFAYFAELVPGAMAMIGAAIPDGIVRPHHTPLFDIDERVLPLGAAVLASSAVRFLRSPAG